MRRGPAWVAVVVAAAVVAGLTGCGRGGAEVTAPAPVPDGLVPASVHHGEFALHETALPVRTSFAEAGPDSLAADGRLWELRKNDRLVGVLQLTTLLPEVDVADTGVRDSIVRQLLPTNRDRYDVGDVTVWAAERTDRTTYLWFGQGMFALLTVRPSADRQPDPEQVLSDVLDHMVAATGFEYVYFDDGEDGEDGAG